MAAEERNVQHKDGSTESTLSRLFNGKRVTDDDIWVLGIRSKREFERIVRDSFPEMSKTIYSRRITGFWPRIRSIIHAKMRESGSGIYVAYKGETPVSYVAADSRENAERMFGLLFSALFKDMVIYKDSKIYSESIAKDLNTQIKKKCENDLQSVEDQIAVLTLRAESIKYVQDICDILTRA